MVASSEEAVGRDCIVPIIKLFKAGSAPADLNLSSGDLNAPVVENLIADLLVCFAFDLPDQYQILQVRHLKDLGMTLSVLRATAISNLAKRLPDIQRHKHPTLPVYAISVNGNLESSLLLLDDLWESQRALISGELVVSVPARDCIAFTDSQSPDGLAELRASIDRAQSNTHLLTRQLLVWRHGNWQPFKENAGEDAVVDSLKYATPSKGWISSPFPITSSDLPLVPPRHRALVSIVGGAFAGLLAVSLFRFEPRSLLQGIVFVSVLGAVAVALWRALNSKK